ncbi:hypothetical protein Tco_1329222 [Tanacetum coccineum]
MCVAETKPVRTLCGGGCTEQKHPLEVVLSTEQTTTHPLVLSKIGDSSGDDTNDEDEDVEDEDEEDEKEEEEHLPPVDSTIVVPTDYCPDSGFHSLPPEIEAERLLALPTPPPSPPISLLPTFTREYLARCTAPPAHSSPPPVPSPLLPSSGCPTQIQTLRIASTQALIDVVTAALPSHPLPPLPPSLYIPPPVDRKDDIPESKQPPRKRSCLFALGPGYEVRESSTARPTEGRGVDPAEAVHEIAPITVGEDSHIIASHYGLAMGRLTYGGYDDSPGDGLSQAIHYELQTHLEQVYAHESQLYAHQTQLQLLGTLIQTQHQIVETLRVMRDMRREMGDMQAELLALREQQRRARQPRPNVRVPDHQDASRDVDSHI